MRQCPKMMSSEWWRGSSFVALSRERMRATQLQDKPMTLGELLPQDLKLEIEQISEAEAMKVARYLAFAVGRAMRGKWMAQRERRGWANFSVTKRNRLTRRCGYGGVWLSWLAATRSDIWNTVDALRLRLPFKSSSHQFHSLINSCPVRAWKSHNAVFKIALHMA